MPLLDNDNLDIEPTLSTNSDFRRPRGIKTKALAACLVLGQSVFSAGCGGDSTATSHPVTPQAVAPTISNQPVAQSVPMGLTATFSVGATGSGVQFQWKKNGVAIAGATDGNYTTPATAFADSGASYSVTVSNSGGSIDSSVAALTVTGRAPIAGDLRFGQVDAPSTVNGWGNATGISTDLLGGSEMSYIQRLGTPLYVGLTGNCDVPPTPYGYGCIWSYSETQPAAYSGSASISANYASDAYANFQSDLQSTTWPDVQMNGTMFSPVSSSSVITSLDLEPANVLFALSWIQSTQESGFLGNQFTVAPANLQATATQEGAAGRVITALSYDSGQVTGFSYAWQADVGNVYESQVVTSSASGAVAAAASLAAQGYIITASGRADDANNVLLVGTRVQGDTVARPFASGPGAAANAAMLQGYSIVAVISDITQVDSTTYLLER